MRIFSLVALAGASAMLVACDRATSPDDAGGESAAPVRTVPVESVEVAREVRTVGVLAPRDEIRLAFKIGGVIDRITVEAGDRVQRGRSLAVLKRAEVDAAVAQAEEAVEKSRRDLERARRLQADEVATEEQVEHLTTAYNVARSDLDAARFNARFARIDAPVDGVVLQRLSEENELVQGGQPVLVLGATGEGWVVRAALVDRDAVRVEPGDTARVAFDAFPGREFEGVVGRIASSADPLTGTFEVEIDVAPGGARFARGLVAKVALAIADGAETEPRRVVPLTAIVEANGPSATLYVIDPRDGVARRRQITIGPIVGDRVVVVAGLEVGEQVATDGAAWLADGEPVRLVVDAG